MRTTGWLGWRKAAGAGLGRRIADFAGVLFLTGLLVGGSCTSNDATKGPSFPSTIAGSGNPAALILRASASSVACGGTVTLTALVVTSTGQPIAGVTVVFEADMGSVSPTSATTNPGEATTTFTATSSLIPTCITGASGATEDAVVRGTAAGTGTATDTITLKVVKP
ncbi:MAG: Ig-like domain-containing protein [Candidatus Rokubacteria bacterium]|nr:Ig-like domain-containing protein [Candidatus Rokubacteria bacterium]